MYEVSIITFWLECCLLDMPICTYNQVNDESFIKLMCEILDIFFYVYDIIIYNLFILDIVQQKAISAHLCGHK